MYYTLFKIVSYNDIVDIEDDENNYTNTSVLQNNLFIGKNLVNIYIKIIYNKFRDDDSNNSDITYSKFKESYINQSRNETLFSDSFYLHLGSKLLEIMTTSNMIEIKVINNSYDNSISVLRLADEVSKLLDRKNPIISLPINLPMIVKPKSYSPNDLGGYLLNDIEYDENLIRGKLGYNIPSSIHDENIIYAPGPLGRGILLLIKWWKHHLKLIKIC